MSVQPLPLCRAAHLLPTTEVLHAIGTPVERRLSQAGLPALFADAPDLYLPVVPALNFIAKAIREEGVDDLGLRVALHFRLNDISRTAQLAIRRAPTLRRALEALCRLAPLEDSSIDFWMARDAGGVMICNLLNLSADAAGLRCSEWTNNIAVIAIVRAFAGPNWSPPEMAFRTGLPLGQFADECFPNTRFLTGQEAAWITVPSAMLALPNPGAGAPRAAAADYTGLEAGESAPIGDFAGALKTTMKSYLCDGYPEISLAAKIAGISVRTLQRNLSRSRATYSDIVEAARFERATEMLADPDHKIIDVALAVGYDDPSHFARAFRRVCGLSPREFRRSHATLQRAA